MATCSRPVANDGQASTAIGSGSLSRSSRANARPTGLVAKPGRASRRSPNYISPSDIVAIENSGGASGIRVGDFSSDRSR